MSNIIDPIEVNPKATLDEALKELSDIKFALDESAIVAVTDAKGVITYVNETFCFISKYSEDELIGKTHRIINSNYHPKSFFQGMWQTIAAGKTWKGEVKNKAKDGSFYWVDTTIVPFLDSSGRSYQYIAIRYDITERKKMEEEIKQLNQTLEQRVEKRTQELLISNTELKRTLFQLKESERLRETFTSALTHDLRTPLIGEKRALELLAQEKDSFPNELLPLISSLVKSNDNLLTLVNRLLEIYQYEAGKISLVSISLSLKELVEECLSELSGWSQSKHLIIHIDIPTNLPTLKVDKHYFKRVLTNLLGNAINYTQEQGSIHFIAQEKGNSIEIKVQDNGPGISSEVLPNLFEHYFLVAHRNKKIGCGLGLYICKMIMELHGGTIWVESELNKGTTFYLTLPKKH